ncbi:MAG: ROK family protein [Patescibacteria group bacterium]
MYIVADIGGTKTRIAGSNDLERFGDPAIVDTPQDYETGIKLVCDTARKIAGDTSIEAFAAGVPGALSDDGRKIHGARHLSLWKERELAKDVEKALSTRVYLENDTAQVGLGEAVYGAGKGVAVAVYITVSTGVNGVRIIDGAVDRGRAEIGGQYLQVADSPKSLEDLISGSAISEKYGVHPKEIEKDSPVWEELAKITAIGVHNSILHWSPDRVILGGSMFNEIGIPVDQVQAHVRNIMKKFPQVPEIVHSSLGEVGGLWGGLARLKRRS